jgi:hypothetical protein
MPLTKTVAIGVLTIVVFTLPGLGSGSSSGKRPLAMVAQTESLGPLLPGSSGAPAMAAVPFHLSIPQTTGARGYTVIAMSSLNFTPAASAAGGRTLAVSDLGVGISGISVMPATNANVTIASGFDYDPMAVRGNSGSSAYAGAAAGQATLSDLLQPREVLRIGKTAGKSAAAGPAELNLVVRVALRPQFFTPGNFSGTITLIVEE